jgi:UDP-glucose 4-epimerase
MSILVTGGMGFIGLHTARRFLDEGQDVVLTQYRARREPDFIKGELGKRAKAEVLDVTSHHDCIDIVRRHKPTGIVHLAVPGLAALSAAEDYRVNVLGLINILEAAHLNDVPRVVLASSIAVYASLREGPFYEDTPLPVESHNPTEAYKKAWEILSYHWSERTGVEVISARLSGIWGPLYHSMANLPSRLVHAAVKGAPTDFTGARGGAPFEGDESDFCYVKDAAAGLVALQLAPSLPNKIYNVAAGVARSNGDIAAAVKKVIPEAQPNLQSGRSPRYRPNQYLDISRTAKDVGYKPQYTVESGVADYIDWLRKGNAQ